MTRRALVAIVVLAPVLALQCGPASSKERAADAGPEAGFGTIRDGFVPPTEQLSCGGGPCDAPPGSALGAVPCCLESGECGATATLLGSECLPLHQAGSVDLSCPERRLPGGAILQGCCTQAARCGVFDHGAGTGGADGGGLGCVAEGAPGGEPECVPATGLECSLVAEQPCDGAEDCGPDRRCCGRLRGAGDRLDRFGCFQSCADLATGTNGVWVELRDPRTVEPPRTGTDAAADAADADAEVTRDAEAGVPRDASDGGEAGAGVGCGAAICREGEKCCLREPLEPSCAAPEAPCTCERKSDAGDGDGDARPPSASASD